MGPLARKIAPSDTPPEQPPFCLLLHPRCVWCSISLGAIAVIAALRFQKGIWGLVRRRVDVQLFPLRRRVDLG